MRIMLVVGFLAGILNTALAYSPHLRHEVRLAEIEAPEVPYRGSGRR
ncbi:hypothetical protein [Nostoc sp.]